MFPALSQRDRPSRSRAVPRPAARRADGGAVAVEFALVLPLLMMFLFGIIQYGYGLYQLQAFNSALSEGSRLATTGISDCGLFTTELRGLVSGNGLDPAKLTDVTVEWVNSDGLATAQRSGLAKVTATYEPFKIGVPFVPFPSEFTRSRTDVVQDIGLNSSNLPLTNCLP